VRTDGMGIRVLVPGGSVMCEFVDSKLRYLSGGSVKSTFSIPARRKLMPYRMAGIDVDKKRLAVVVADVEVEDEYQFERRWYGSNPEQLRVLSEWLIERQVEEVVMESTAQYWKPVWGAVERYWKPMCQSREGAGRMS